MWLVTAFKSHVGQSCTAQGHFWDKPPNKQDMYYYNLVKGHLTISTSKNRNKLQTKFVLREAPDISGSVDLSHYPRVRPQTD